MGISAIETRYKGYRFRSRLEARWAVYFDAIGIEWEYEPEGFNLGGILYLPDFWLPQVSMWAEVKAVGLKGDEWRKCQRLANESFHPVLMLVGTPDFRSYWAIGSNLDGEEDLCDYILDTSFLNEGRFWGSSGADYPSFLSIDYHYCCHDFRRAVEAARSSRFEHGEEPSSTTYLKA